MIMDSFENTLDIWQCFREITESDFGGMHSLLLLIKSYIIRIERKHHVKITCKFNNLSLWE